MINTVYTPQLVKAIIEETRLNADPGSNGPLYDLLRYGRNVLSRPQPESFSPVKISSVEDKLAAYPQSYAASHYRERLLEFEAERIIQVKDVFKLAKVSRLVEDLGEYRTPQALQARQELYNLCQVVQEAKGYAHRADRIGLSEESRAQEVLKVLEPYARKSEEVSGVRKLLADQLWLQDPFFAFTGNYAEEDQPAL